MKTRNIIGKQIDDKRRVANFVIMVQHSLMRHILIPFAIMMTGTAVFAENAGPPTVWFRQGQEEVANILANLCADRNGTVAEQDNFHVLCTKQVSGVRGALMQALVGNSYSTTPELRIRFAIMKDGKGTRVQASQWVETQMAMGQVRREPMNGRKQSQELIDVLLDHGAHNIPIDVIDSLPPQPDGTAQK